MRHLALTVIVVGSVGLLGIAAPHSHAAGIDAHLLCSDCHLARNDTATAFGSILPAADTCVGCHREQRSTIEAVHACVGCHAHHPNGSPAQLRQPEPIPGAAGLDPVTQLCLSCHDQAGTMVGPEGHFLQHPVGVTLERPPTGGILPLFDVNGTADPDDDVIGCLTCHIAHRSHQPMLLRWTEAEEPVFCSSCHDLTAPPAQGLRRR